MALSIILASLGIIGIITAAAWGESFHPPGYGYDQEARDQRTSFRITGGSFILLAAAGINAIFFAA